MIIGRKKEIELLNHAMQDERSHFIAIYGRRRVGKTYLVRETFGYRFTFQHAGLSEGGLDEQLHAFSTSLRETGAKIKKKPVNWLEAFDLLREIIKNSPEKKKVVFIDELSWMDTPKSGFLTALENFWNGFASSRNDVIFIVCASATSWMLSKVVHNKGGLYNRLTEQINLQTFSLKECEDYVRAQGLVLNRTQVLQYYMIFGGVPYYWGFLERGISLSQNIDKILFDRNAPLKKEFEYLYASVFKNPEVYLKIIESLGTKKVGMTREEIITASGIINSGDLTIKLEELESCGFIRKYYAFGMKKKNCLYQLIDCFTLFYYKFIINGTTDEHFWSNQVNTPKINTWQGLAFERVCMEHYNCIKEKLGISGVLAEVNSFSCRENLDIGLIGSQIDMLIIRKDQVINLCEIKYSNSEYIINDKFEKSLNNKIRDLVSVSGTKYAIHPTLITTFGLVDNAYSNCIQSVVTLDDLFR